jgi:alpha-D-ribose 1-methylphosphonate 5-triphosphate synthase subunit PhnG
MSVLARCPTMRLESLWLSLGLEPEHTRLRGPETGMVMLRGRVGGTGEAFNVGEATVTRATVKLGTGEVGHAMALGRDHAKAKLAALIDALCQDVDMASRIDAEIIQPIERELAEADDKRSRETAATRVDFFTLVRGED